ncbi:MAG: Dabb family protein [Opitutaceae bacterium]
MLIHPVFFWRKPGLTEAQCAEFRRGVESLAAIKHIEKVCIGVPAAVADRPVVDKTFAVGLTVICRVVPAHNAYPADPIHLAFVAKFKSCWTRGQIYDTE